MSIETFMNENADLPSGKIEYPLSKVAANEWKEFALYSVESRAIASLVDGMKPSQRFYLYSSIKNTPKEFKKVESVAGTITDYGYNHGTNSAAGAGQLMAAEWNNNVVLVEGQGSFGTRLVQRPAAARYTKTRLHPNFYEYVKDLDLAPKHADPEHMPPAHYIPIIPLVLANGIRGIATGFATNILPRDPLELASACKEYIKTGNIKNRVKIKFPEFTGEVVYNPIEDRYYCNGTFERKSKTVIVITEVPVGYEQETYVKILDKLEDSGEIVGYDDLCKDGFRFEVKLKLNNSNWSDEKIMSQFKLSKIFSENLTVIGLDGKIKEYTDERDLIKDFCEYRNLILQKRIDLRKNEYAEAVRWMYVKMQFIRAVLDEKITFKGHKKDAVSKQILLNTKALTEDCDRLLRLNIMTLTDEMVQQLKVEIGEAETDLKFWETTTVKDQFLYDLDELSKV